MKKLSRISFQSKTWTGQSKKSWQLFLPEAKKVTRRRSVLSIGFSLCHVISGFTVFEHRPAYYTEEHNGTNAISKPFYTFNYILQFYTKFGNWYRAKDLNVLGKTGECKYSNAIT